MSTLVIKEINRTKEVELKFNTEKNVKSIEIYRATNGSNFEKMVILGEAIFPITFPLKTFKLGGVSSAK